MGTKRKNLDPNASGVRALLTDVDRDSVRYYRIDSFPQGVVSPQYLDKCSEVIVAASGSVDEGATWLGVFPRRIDQGPVEAGGALPKCYDLDPMIFVFDDQTNEPLSSGVVAYHQDFGGRTTEISGFEYDTIQDTVTNLRARALDGAEQLSTAPAEVLSGLHHMADLIRRQSPDLGRQQDSPPPPTDPPSTPG